MILIFDFGSQTTHLIGRRLKDIGVDIEICDPKRAMLQIKTHKPNGIILSGGYSFVNLKGAPTIDKKIFSLGIPILGICYGWQLTAYHLGGKVESAKHEYGPVQFQPTDFKDIFYGVPDNFQVFESHGDSVIQAPKNFELIGSTENVVNAAMKHTTKKIFGVQFHPEVTDTKYGTQILKNFATRICNLALQPKEIDINNMIEEIREKVGDSRVIGAVSGGTDSSIAATLVAKAIGKQFTPIYVESGLMRADTLGRIKNEFPKLLGIPVKVVYAKQLFLKKLKGVKDPEKKRKTIGKLYIDLFEKEMKKDKRYKFLLQGTTYADFIHSQGNKKSALIKSHHNVGGLPKNMQLKLLEPIRYFYTDQVRELGVKLGLPKDVVYQQPFPGPGHAVRIVGALTKTRLEQQVQADQILCEELKKSGWYDKIFQGWTIMTGTNSTGVKGDGRFYGEVVALRILNSKDRMTADWVRIPYEILAKISARIVNEVPGVSRVVYDITSKPPATMEWE